MAHVKEFFISRYHSFENAFRGFWFVIKTQKNAWLHAIVTSAVILLSIWLQLPARDWAVLVLTIALVWSAEFFNTAIEAVVDLASPAQHPLAKTGKDIGAAAVLITALAALLVGLLLLGPPLWERLSYIFNN